MRIRLEKYLYQYKLALSKRKTPVISQESKRYITVQFLGPCFNGMDSSRYTDKEFNFCLKINFDEEGYYRYNYECKYEYI